MIANFHLEYATKWGEQIVMKLHRNGKEETILCQSFDGRNWLATIQTTDKEQIEYKYMVKTEDASMPEFGANRELSLPKGLAQVFVQDYWRPTDWAENAFFSAAFKDVIFRREEKKKKKPRTKKSTKNKIIFQLNAAAIEPHQVFCVCGSGPALGDWKKPILLSDENYPLWSAEVKTAETVADLEYKFAIYDTLEKRIVEWEEGENRKLHFTFPSENGNAVARTDERFRYSSGLWRGAGVAIPVFSLRSEKGLGIGEFTDLKLMVDWAAKTKMKFVQVLPVNDTIGSKTWKDSYPYRAISVFALHPMFVNVEAIAKLKDKKAAAKLKRKTAALNKLEVIDFEAVMEAKMEFFHLLFEQEKSTFLKDKAAKDFIAQNAEWLKPYAAFCFLRDTKGTVNFNQWGEEATYTEAIVDKLCDPKAKIFDDIAFHYFIQFHAHSQLFGATEYARQNGVVLKGDLPIGIGRHSCDAWVAPQLYNMDGQAGAPPDFYAEDGQNWNFPTYDWEEMAKDNFAWWRKRMTKLAEYFDALRIDHILGFFRIWEIPTDQVIGTMGVYNPHLPYSRTELAGFGLHGDLSRYTRPYIRGHFLGEIFGDDADFVRENFLQEIQYGVFELAESVDNQLKIKQLFENDKGLSEKKNMKKGLMKLVSEVLLLVEKGSNGPQFNPRITLEMTRSFQELPDREQAIFRQLYNDYHFDRHEDFWRSQALWKLPPLLRATNMLICGEDLGMIPKSVAGVMRQLNIITLEIQRAPKGDSAFGNPEQYPYTSVASPSCHDMSTIRGWWLEDRKKTQLFFNTYISPQGPAPAECTPGIVETINWQHLESPSILAIFPLQDLVGMDAQLRRADAEAEQINQPGDPEHYWRYRFHLPLEKLLEADGLNNKVEAMVEETGRG